MIGAGESFLELGGQIGVFGKDQKFHADLSQADPRGFKRQRDHIPRPQDRYSFDQKPAFDCFFRAISYSSFFKFLLAESDTPNCVPS